jgi:hypothetical protein
MLTYSVVLHAIKSLILTLSLSVAKSHNMIKFTRQSYSQGMLMFIKEHICPYAPDLLRLSTQNTKHKHKHTRWILYYICIPSSLPSIMWPGRPFRVLHWDSHKDLSLRTLRNLKKRSINECVMYLRGTDLLKRRRLSTSASVTDPRPS